MLSGRHSALVGVVFGAVACGRIGYDPVQGGISSTGVAGTTGTGAGGIGGATGTAGQGGSAPPFDAAADLTPPNDASGPPATCSQAGSPTMTWSFDTDVQGWQLSGSGTMVWNGTVGSPTPGALQVDWTGQSIQPRLVQALGNLMGRIVTARIWLDAGTNAEARIFVQTGTRQVWADSGFVPLTQGQWTCLALDIDNPVFSRQQYDPTNVQILGVDMDAGSTSRLYIDTVAY